MSTYSPCFSVFKGSSDGSRITASFFLALLTYHNNAYEPPTPVRIIRTRVVLASMSRLDHGKGGFMMEMPLLVPKTPSINNISLSYRVSAESMAFCRWERAIPCISGRGCKGDIFNPVPRRLPRSLIAAFPKSTLHHGRRQTSSNRLCCRCRSYALPSSGSLPRASFTDSWVKSLWKRETPEAWSKGDSVIRNLADNLLACLLILIFGGLMSS